MVNIAKINDKKKHNLKEQSPKKHSIITSVIKEMRAL